MSLSMRNIVSRRVTNKDVQYNNRLTQFTNPPIHTGDLYVINDLTVGGNTYLNNLEIRKNLKVYGDTSVQKIDVSNNLTVIGNTSLKKVDISGNLTVDQNILAYGSIFARQYLPGQIVNVAMFSNTDLSQNDLNIGGGVTSTVFSYSYSPKIANSYILIEYQTIYTLGGSNNDEMFAYLYGDNTGPRLSYTYQHWVDGVGGGTRSGTIFPIVGRYTNTDITAKDIRVDVYNHTDDTVNIQSNSSTWLKITEIGR